MKRKNQPKELWNLEDPKGKSIEDVREIRDEIEKRVKELVSAITVTTKR